MPTWTQTFQDTFTRANGAVGNSWTDTASVFSIVSNTLQSSAAQYWTDLLERPAGEALADMQIQAVVTAQTGGNSPLFWIGTNTTSKSGYVCWLSNNINIGILVNGAQPPQNIQTSAVTITAGQDYLITFNRVGSSLTATVALNSAPTTILGSTTLTDSTYGTGVASISPLAGANTVKSITVFTGNGPTVGALSINSNTSASGITFHATITGGAAPYTSTLYRSTTAPFTPPGTGTSVAATSGSSTSLSLADPTPPAGDNFYRIYTVDNTSASTLSAQSSNQGALLARQNAAPIFIGAIGDSMTLGSFGSGTTPLQYMTAALADILPMQPITTSNQAISGTKSSDWIVTGSTYATAKSAFATAVAAMSPAPAKKFVVLMLGTNDAQDAVLTTPSNYAANISGIVNDLVASGYIVILNPSPFIPATSTGWSEQANTYLVQYRSALAALSNGYTIAMGIPTALEYFSQNPSLFSGTPPHLNDTGYSILGGQLWASGFLSYFAPAVPTTATIAAAVAATILKSPANLLTTDTAGNVTVGSLTTPAISSITSSGSGPIAINQNTGGADSLRYVDTLGNGIPGASILIYNATDWPTNPTNIQATSTTASDGRWLTPAYVSHGTFIAVFTKPGSDGPNASAPFTV